MYTLGLGPTYKDVLKKNLFFASRILHAYEASMKPF